MTMRWYFAIDEAGAAGQTGQDAVTAVRSAWAVGGLEPVLLYHGAPCWLTDWMGRHGVEVVATAPSFLDAIRAGEAAGTYRAHSVGHWLRLAVPQIEQAREWVLYTDCDVIFLKPVNWSGIRPRVFAAAPEFRRDNWNYFNAGVMVLNVGAMRATYPAFEAHMSGRIAAGAHPYYDDELALNEAYRGQWERLDPALNWKPYWGYAAAGLLHFHGPKLNAIEPIAAGHWRAEDPTAVILEKLTRHHAVAYRTWLTSLGDRLQLTDPALAIRMQRVAADLARLPREANPDTSYLDFNMFP